MDVLNLNDEQVASYEENGFVVSEPVFDETELVALRAAADELLTNAGPLVPGNHRVAIEAETLDGKSMVRRIEPVIDLSPALAELVVDSRMTGPVARLFGEPVFLFEDKLNYKAPHVGLDYGLHQDYKYWTEYTNRLITVTLYLDDATPENGCLRLVPGSHRQGLVEPDSEGRLVAWDIDLDAVDAPGPAGSLVVFSCYTAHHSYTNRTPKGRRAILCTYNPASDGDIYPRYMAPMAEKYRAWAAAHDVVAE